MEGGEKEEKRKREVGNEERIWRRVGEENMNEERKKSYYRGKKNCYFCFNIILPVYIKIFSIPTFSYIIIEKAI
jgi:hypothetical protein